MSVQWHRVLAADELPDGRVTTVAAAYARNCGALGVRVTDRAALDATLAAAVAHDGPAMVEVITDPNLV